MSRLNKRLLIIAVIIALMSWLISGCINKEKEEAIIARVDGEAITQEEFDEDFEMSKNVRQKQFGEDILLREMENNKTYEEILREDILEKLIIEKIMAKELDKLNITVTDKEVNEAIKTYYIDELGGEEQYKEYLQNNGFTEEFFKKELRKTVMYEKHREDFYSKINLSEDEIKEYFDKNKDSLIKVRVSHILVKTEEEGNKVLEKLNNGEDFHNLVAIESADPDSAIQGGDLGYFTKGELLESYRELEDVAFTLEIGEVSRLIKTELGYHIILLEDRKDSYEELKEDIVPVLKYNRYFEKILDLREKADVKIYMDDENNKN